MSFKTTADPTCCLHIRESATDAAGVFINQGSTVVWPAVYSSTQLRTASPVAHSRPRGRSLPQHKLRSPRQHVNRPCPAPVTDEPIPPEVTEHASLARSDPGSPWCSRWYGLCRFVRPFPSPLLVATVGTCASQLLVITRPRLTKHPSRQRPPRAIHSMEPWCRKPFFTPRILSSLLACWCFGLHAC